MALDSCIADTRRLTWPAHLWCAPAGTFNACIVRYEGRYLHVCIMHTPTVQCASPSLMYVAVAGRCAQWNAVAIFMYWDAHAARSLTRVYVWYGTRLRAYICSYERHHIYTCCTYLPQVNAELSKYLGATRLLGRYSITTWLSVWYMWSWRWPERQVGRYLCKSGPHIENRHVYHK